VSMQDSQAPLPSDADNYRIDKANMPMRKLGGQHGSKRAVVTPDCSRVRGCTARILVIADHESSTKALAFSAWNLLDGSESILFIRGLVKFEALGWRGNSTSCNGGDSSPEMKSLTRNENTVVRCSRKRRNFVSQRHGMHGGSRHLETVGGGAKRRNKNACPWPEPACKESEDNHSPGDWMKDDDFLGWGTLPTETPQFDSVSARLWNTVAAWGVPSLASRRGPQSGASSRSLSIVPDNSQFNCFHRMNPRGKPLRH
jgi:hypothetical protein